MVPAHVHRQEDLETVFLERVSDRRTRLLLRRSLAGAGIETRHSVCAGFFESEPFDAEGRATTGERNAVFAREARRLSRKLGEKILSGSGFEPGEVTHVVFASCTGFANPGPDYHLIADLGLRPTVQRYLLGFMGCYATVPTLRLGRDICGADDSAVVLVIALELCSLHFKMEASYDAVLANSLFGDGAGGAIITGEAGLRGRRPAARLDSFCTDIIPEGESDMAWTIGDRGFDLVLSNQVPRLLENRVGPMVRGVVDPGEIEHWAVHPGGKGILDKVEADLSLASEDLAVAREVLRRYGNLAGATVFFVLEGILERAEPGDRIMALAFGPGFTVEAGLLTSFPP